MRIVHLADLHLGYRAYNRVNERGYNIREADVFSAFTEALQKIEQISPDLIILAGDIFHKPRPSNHSILVTIRLLKQFRKNCQAPIVMIAGNHETVKLVDSGSILSIFEATIPDVKVFDKDIRQYTIDSIDTSLLCVPHGGLSSLNEICLKPDKSYKHNIMIIHGSYESCPQAIGYGDGALIKETEINQPEWDYIAFGHYHRFTEIAKNAFYSGAIERTSTNIWQEAEDKKGFIEYDFETRICKFHSLSTPRRVVDIKRINAENLTAEEINNKITEEVSKIKDFEKSIVRVTVENIDPVAIRELDYRKIREYKKHAVHFRLNLIRKDAVIASINSKGEPVEKKRSLEEYLEEELAGFELSQGLDKERFKALTLQYIGMNQG